MKAAGGPSRHAVLLFVLGQIFVATTIGNARRSLRHPAGGGEASHLRARETIAGELPPMTDGRAPPLPPRARLLDRSQLPYPCGLVFFYHVPSTGGATINKWYERRYAKVGTVAYFTKWARNKDGSAKEGIQEIFLHGNDEHGGMDDFVRDIGPNEWRVSHCHHSSMQLNVTEDYLSRWRTSVESQGCAFVANVMFRDPLSHAMSLYKHVNRFKSNREVWAKHLETTSEQGHWQTQLDYFLYNFIDRNPDGVELS